MKKKLILSQKEIAILGKLAKRSKMDCWFSIGEDGKIRDLESKGKTISTRKAVAQLADGLTDYDMEVLENGEKTAFAALLKRL